MHHDAAIDAAIELAKIEPTGIENMGLDFELLSQQVDQAG